MSKGLLIRLRVFVDPDLFDLLDDEDTAAAEQLSGRLCDFVYAQHGGQACAWVEGWFNETDFDTLMKVWPDKTEAA